MNSITCLQIPQSKRAKNLIIRITSAANSMMKNFGIDPLACPAATKIYFLALAAEGKGKLSLAKDYRLKLFNSYMAEKNFNLAESFARQNKMDKEASQAQVQRAVSLSFHENQN